MKRRLKILLFIYSLMMVMSGYACSTFCLDNGKDIAFGHNLGVQWYAKGYIILNPKNIKKTAFMPWQDKPAKWTTRHDSITLSFLGKELPIAGMNSQGLFISGVGVNRCQYPNKDNRSSLTALQWIQYQLDTAATIKDVLSNTKNIRITNFDKLRLHFFVGDKTGDVAVIEFLNGKMFIYNKKSLPEKILTNWPYSQCFSSWNKIPNKNSYVIKPTYDSTDFPKDYRFNSVAYLINKFKEINTKVTFIDYAFNILKQIQINLPNKYKIRTCWNLIFNPKDFTVYWKTYKNTKIKQLKLSNLDFASKTKFIDINNNNLKFESLTSKENKLLIDNNLKLMPEDFRQLLHKNNFCKKLEKYENKY